MRVFTIHHRPAGPEYAGQDRTRLVREGFSLWAFLFGPLWLVWRGLWLALLGYLLAVAAVAFLPDPWNGPLAIAVQILLGFHAHDLERWTLRRRGFAADGVVVGEDEEEAMLRALRARPALLRGAMA